MSNRVKTITIEYETTDNIVWKAGVLAYDIKEAVQTIVDNVPNYQKLISTGVNREIDIISKKVSDNFFNNKIIKPTLTEGKMKSNVKEPTTKEKPVGNPPSPKVDKVDDSMTCPFCSKSYKTERTLLKHIKEYH